MTRRRRALRLLGRLVLAGLGALVWAAWPGCSTHTIGPDTTHVTGPLDADGHVDYVAALNERLRGDTTPEQNANVAIWQALGPRPEGRDMPEECFRWLGIAPPPFKGDYFQSLGRFLLERDGPRRQRDATPPAPSPDCRRRFWSAPEHPDVAAWLAAGEGPLDLIVAGSARPRYFNPLVPPDDHGRRGLLLSAPLPSAARCRGVADALLCRSMLRAEAGRLDEAAADLIAVRRLGRHVAEGTLIELLIGLAIEGLAMPSEVALLQHPQMTAERIERFAAALDAIPPMPVVGDKFDCDARLVFLDLVLRAARDGPGVFERLGDGGSPPPARWQARLFTRDVDWDPALRLVNEWFDRAATDLRTTDRVRRDEAMAAFADDIRRLKRECESRGELEKLATGPQGRGRQIGAVVVALMFPAYDKVLGAGDRQLQHRANLRVACALALHRVRRGRHPASLAELVPAFLPQLPLDSFDAQPLRYRRTEAGYELHSVGSNGIDDGGTGYDDSPPGDDLVIRVPARPVAREP